MPDKYLLLFIMMIGLQGLTLKAEHFTPSANRKLINLQDTVPYSKPDTLPSGIVVIPPTQGRLYTVGDIFISGNKITKSFTITREMPFHTGDSVTLQQLTRYFAQAREHLINTRLFNEVTVSLKDFRGYTVDINISVKERWYIFPLPYVRPVDRNFTAWAQQGYSLSRFDYGLKYSQYNFTGRNDYLRVWLITGYSREIEMAYDRPNTGKNLVHGFGGGFVRASGAKPTPNP